MNTVRDSTQFVQYLTDQMMRVKCKNPMHDRTAFDICIDERCRERYFQIFCNQCRYDKVSDHNHPDHLSFDMIDLMRDFYQFLRNQIKQKQRNITELNFRVDDLISHINQVAMNLFQIAKIIQREQQALITQLNLTEDQYEKTLSILYDMVNPENSEKVIAPCLRELRTRTFVDIRDKKLYVENTTVVHDIQNQIQKFYDLSKNFQDTFSRTIPEFIQVSEEFQISLHANCENDFNKHNPEDYTTKRRFEEVLSSIQAKESFEERMTRDKLMNISNSSSRIYYNSPPKYPENIDQNLVLQAKAAIETIQADAVMRANIQCASNEIGVLNIWTNQNLWEMRIDPWERLSRFSGPHDENFYPKYSTQKFHYFNQLGYQSSHLWDCGECFECNSIFEEAQKQISQIRVQLLII